MSIHVTEAAAQIRWWLRLPPTNLIDRGDHIRFRYALYLMIHQMATVLYGINGLPEVMYYPSRLKGARARLDGLHRAPERAGSVLWTLATDREPEQAWAAAAGLMRATLKLLSELSDDHGLLGQKFGAGSYKPEPSRDPDALYALAAETAERMRLLQGTSAVALGGSLGRGVADRQSDIDLLVFGPGIPREDDRLRLFSAWPNVATEPLVEPACDSVLLDGAMVHIRYWTRQTVEDMLAAFPAPPAQRILAEELQNCHILIDPDGRLIAWKSVLEQLPVELVKAAIGEVRKRLPAFREQWQMALESDDRIHLYCLANQAVNDFLIALYIRNGRFLSTPRWVHKEIPAFNILPGNPETGLISMIDGIGDRMELESRWQNLEDFWEGLAS